MQIKKTLVTSVEPTCHRVISSEIRLLDLWEKGEVFFVKRIYIPVISLSREVI